MRESHAGTRILLVEDDLINQEIASVLLREAGMRVDVAGDGAQAVELARGRTYDLILMDLQMPVMDGVEATRRIRAMDHGRDVPIIALTANIYDEDRKRCQGAGMNDFVGKPVDPLELFATILKWLPKAQDVHLPVLQAPRAVKPQAQAATPLDHQLRAIPGLDLDAGLASVRGDMGWYWRLLGEFLAFHADDMLQLRKALERQQQSVAIRVAHTLKGSAAALGLVGLQADAIALEAQLTEGITDVERVAARITQSLADLAQAVRGIDMAQTQSPAPPDPGRVGDVLADLQATFKRGDFRAQQVFRDHRALLRSNLPTGVFSQLEGAVEGYDFEAASRVVESLQQAS